MDWSGMATFFLALGGTGTVAALAGAGKKVWDTREDAGYQRRVKEEQQEEALETIEVLEGEAEGLTDELEEERAERRRLEKLFDQQQQIIADQARALANLDPGKGVSL